MNERRIDDLLRLLDSLQRLQDSGFTCRTEINEVISMVKAELEIGEDKPKKPPHKVVAVDDFYCETRYDLTDVPTAQLTDELAKREGVTEYSVDAHGGFAKLHVDNGEYGYVERIEGPARIIVNKD